jgi:hypothetical protein
MHLLLISLLSILAGTLLLSKFKKEEAGRFFRLISWFFIVVGFLLFIGFAAGAVCKCSHHGKCGMGTYHKEVMIKGLHHGDMDKSCCSPGCCKGMKSEACCPSGGGKEKCAPKEGCRSHRMPAHCRSEAGDSLASPADKE